MKHCGRFLVAAVIVCLATEAWAVNSVVVESKQVAPGATGVTIGVYVTNDINVLFLAVPLEIRALTPGSFTTNVFSLTAQGRLGSHDWDLILDTEYNVPGTNTCSGPVSSTFPTEAPVGFTSPDAVMWAAQQFFGPALAPGTDGSPGSGTPSILLTFNVTGVEGYFEIDTCCIPPVTHLLFINPPQEVVPSFTKGTITIGNPPPPNDPPVAVCAPLVTMMDPGTCERASVAPAEVDGGSYDPDADPITLRLNPLGPYPAGVNNVWLVVTDDPGDTDSCQTTVTVEDNKPPTAVCPSDIMLEVAYGETGAVVPFIIDADDNCPGVTVGADPASGSFFPIGTTLVAVTAYDGAGNGHTCYFNVVIDAALPCNERPADVNCDGVVDILDVIAVVNPAFRGEPEPITCCADGP